MKNNLKMTTFKKSDNSLVSLGVGQRALITNWLDEMHVTNYTINDDYTIDVEGCVDLHGKNLDKLPSYIKFGIVGISFYCSNNQLVSLDGSPREVGISFYCYNNKKQFTEKDVTKFCNVGGYIYV
jgi:hypothetical protein